MAVTKFVEPLMNKNSSGLPTIESKNQDETGNKTTCAQSLCIAVGVLNIIVQACVIILCWAIVGAGSTIFAEWMYPWHHWNRAYMDNPTMSELNLAKSTLGGKKHYEGDTILGLTFAIVGPFIMLSACSVSLGMNIALIHGVVKRSASTVKAFIIYSGVVLPLYLIVNTFYLAMICVHQVTDPQLIAPHVSILIMNIIFAAELLLACKTHTQLKNLSQFTATRLQEF